MDERETEQIGREIKMKKYITIFFTVIVLSMVCACGQDNVDHAQINHIDITDVVKPIEELSIIQKEEISILPEEERSVYEAYLTVTVEGRYLYAYFDYDNDGKQELYLRGSDASSTYGYVMKYADGGLKKIGSGDVSQENIDRLEWNEIERDNLTDTANAEEMTHEGVYAFIDQNAYGENSIWYVDEQSFLSQYGFWGSTPFYEYVLPDGSIRLILYYDEQTGLGCGLRYFQRDPSDMMTSGKYGFSFQGTADETDLWWDGLSIDYTKFESCWGDTGSSYAAYEENIEYDDAKRVVHFDASGIIEEDEEPEYLLWMDYEYDDNGILRQRQYYHNYRAFSTSYQTWCSYFDELGRLEHEDLYITHGSIDCYYIYFDESTKPTYCLFLDNNIGWWIPEFVKL